MNFKFCVPEKSCRNSVNVFKNTKHGTANMCISKMQVDGSRVSAFSLMSKGSGLTLILKIKPQILSSAKGFYVGSNSPFSRSFLTNSNTSSCCWATNKKTNLITILFPLQKNLRHHTSYIAALGLFNGGNSNGQ